MRVSNSRAGSILLAVLLPTTAHAAVVSTVLSPEATASFWTAARYAEARPLPMGEGIDEAVMTAAFDDQAEIFAATQSAEGQAPHARARTAPPVRLLDHTEGAFGLAAAVDGPLIDTATASGAFFTSGRLVPANADLYYPYTTVGRLYFTSGGTTFYCSASVIRARLVVTSGQCVHAGHAPGFFTNFQFVPAYRSGVAQLGVWNGAAAFVHTTWSTGGGGVPNSADWGVIELQDRVVSAVTRKVSYFTGFLGYIIQKLRPNHAHILAYASNFDAGEKQHQVTAQAFRAAAQNNAEYGSDMRSGSAGGPLIQDFGDNPVTVKWIGSLSYYYNPTATKLQGASTPDAKFTLLINTACAHRAGNC